MHITPSGVLHATPKELATFLVELSKLLANQSATNQSTADHANTGLDLSTLLAILQSASDDAYATQ